MMEKIDCPSMIVMAVTELDYDGYVAMEFLALGNPVANIATARSEALVAATG